MFGRRKKKAQQPIPEAKPEEKPTPAYLRDDYPYKAVGDPIEDISTLEDSGVVYEIRCPKCETVIRSQGKNIKATYVRLMDGNGCLNCGNKELEVKLVNMDAAKNAPVAVAADTVDAADDAPAESDTAADAQAGDDAE